MCRSEISIWLTSDEYLEHGSRAKCLKIADRLREMKKMKREKKSVNIRKSLKAVNKQHLLLLEKLKNTSRAQFDVTRGSLKLRAVVETRRPLMDSLLDHCLDLLTDDWSRDTAEVDRLANDTSEVKTRQKRIGKTLNDAYICPIHLLAHRIMDMVIESIVKLFTFIEDVNRKLNQRLGNLRRYDQMQTLQINRAIRNAW